MTLSRKSRTVICPVCDCMTEGAHYPGCTPGLRKVTAERDRLREALRHVLDEGGYLNPIWGDEYAEEWALIGYTPEAREATDG